MSLERKVAEERALRENIDAKVTGLTDHLKKASLTGVLGSVETAAKPEDLKVGAAELQEIIQLAGAFQQSAVTAESNLSQQTHTFQAKVKVLLTQWKTREQAVLSQIDLKRKELAGKGIPLDLPYIKKLAADEANYLQTLKTLAQWETNLKELQNGRQALLGRRRAIRAEIYKRRYAYAIKANDALKKALSDLSVTIKFSENASSPDAEQIIRQAMGWRTVQVPRATLVVQQVTIPQLLDAVQKNDPTLIMRVADKSGLVFNKNNALDLIQALKISSTFFQLERCSIDDLPRITVTRVVDTGGKPQAISRDFAKLSLGQQQSILLALMLSSDSKAPLIIDQPEDNLDSEFIFHSLVPVLRAAKERRQIIVVTHNPNIAVLGDAEQIIALKSASDRSMIVARGSIDEPKTREMVCQILEGAKEAFKKRAKMYGVI